MKVLRQFKRFFRWDRKLAVIWKIQIVLKSSGKLAVIWKNQDSFEIIRKIGNHLANPDSFEIIRKIGTHLEKILTVLKIGNNLEKSGQF